MKAIVIEDGKGVAEVIRDCIKRCDAEVFIARDWQEFLELAKIPPPPDLVTYDVFYPGGNDQNARERILEIHTMFPETNVLILSGMLPDDQAALIADASRADFIAKDKVAKGPEFYRKIAYKFSGKPGYERNVALLEELAEQSS